MFFINCPLIWSQETVDKIAQKHNVTPEEVEEAIYDDDAKGQKGRSGSSWLYAQTQSGRYLFIVLRKIGRSATYKVITAREMQEKEKQYYQNQSP